jgi:hypothetical protein
MEPPGEVWGNLRKYASLAPGTEALRRATEAGLNNGEDGCPLAGIQSIPWFVGIQ